MTGGARMNVWVESDNGSDTSYLRHEVETVNSDGCLWETT